jgi:hypothetical protein
MEEKVNFIYVKLQIIEKKNDIKSNYKIIQSATIALWRNKWNKINIIKFFYYYIEIFSK